MPGLGLSLSTFPGAVAAAIEDYVWKITGSDLSPIDGIAYDFSDSWDVTSI